MATQLCICTSKIRSANQLSEDRSSIYGGHSLLSILAPTSCGATCSRNACTAANHGTMSSRQVIATMLRIEIDQNQPLLTDQDFLQNLQGFKKLQSSKIVTSVRFCQCNWRDGFLVLILKKLPRILPQYGFVVFICLMTNDIKHCFICSSIC